MSDLFWLISINDQMITGNSDKYFKIFFQFDTNSYFPSGYGLSPPHLFFASTISQWICGLSVLPNIWEMKTVNAAVGWRCSRSIYDIPAAVYRKIRTPWEVYLIWYLPFPSLTWWYKWVVPLHLSYSSRTSFEGTSRNAYGLRSFVHWLAHSFSSQSAFTGHSHSCGRWLYSELRTE